MWVEREINVDLLACLLGCSSSLHCNIGAVGVYNPLYLCTMVWICSLCACPHLVRLMYWVRALTRLSWCLPYWAIGCDCVHMHWTGSIGVGMTSFALSCLHCMIYCNVCCGVLGKGQVHVSLFQMWKREKKCQLHCCCMHILGGLCGDVCRLGILPSP